MYSETWLVSGSRMLLNKNYQNFDLGIDFSNLTRKPQTKRLTKKQYYSTNSDVIFNSEIVKSKDDK